MLTSEEAAYIAGFTDGEGLFTINRRRHVANGHEYLGYSAYFELVNTDKSVMDWIHSKLGCTAKLIIQDLPSGKKAYRIRSGARQSLQVAEMLLPYLQIKRKAAEVLLQMPMNHKKSDREFVESLYWQMRDINNGNGRAHSHIYKYDAISPRPILAEVQG